MPLTYIGDMQGGHLWLIRSMSSLNYVTNPRGECFGVTRMSTQAILLEDVYVFNFRLFALRLAYEAADKSNFDQSYNAIFHSFLPLVQLDCHAFFNGVTVYQWPDGHRELLYDNPQDKPYIDQWTTAGFELLQPKQLQMQGGVTLVADFTLPCNLADMISLFQHYDAVFAGINFPVAFELYNAHHAISVGYLPNAAEKWYVLDSGDFPAYTTSNIYALATSLFSALVDCFECPHFMLSADMYVTKNNLNNVLSLLNSPESISVFNKIFTLSSEKIFYVDGMKNSWLIRLMERGRVGFDFVVSLIRAGSPIDIVSTSLGVAPLHIAVTYHWTNIVVELLNAGAMVDVLNVSGETPLFIAVNKGLIDMVKILLDHNAFISCRDMAVAKRLEDKSILALLQNKWRSTVMSAPLTFIEQISQDSYKAAAKRPPRRRRKHHPKPVEVSRLECRR